MRRLSKWIRIFYFGIIGNLFYFGISTNVFAMTLLKQVQVSNSAQIDLLFDGKISKSQIQTEFFNDIIQLSIVDVTVYPAKISSVNGGLLTKVFAYQYAPRLVRCRLSVTGKAEDYKDRLVINTSGKIATIRINNPTTSVEEKIDQVSVQSSAPMRIPSSPNTMVNHSVETNPKVKVEKTIAESDHFDTDEKKLLARVINAPVQRSNTQVVGSADSKNKPTHQKLLGSQKPLPSISGILMKLAIVLGIFGVFVVILKKIMGVRASSSTSLKIPGVSDREIVNALGNKNGVRGVFSSLGRFAQHGLGRLGKFGNKEQMIEVLSNHHLGPKQSIAVVRVCGKKMVLGIANDSISLISQLADNQEKDGDDFDLDRNTAFSELLTLEKSKPVMSDGVRARIRTRLEGLKPL